MIALIFFISLPVLGFVFSLSDLRKPLNGIVFILFYTLYGYCQHFSLETADVARIGWDFQISSSADAIRSFDQGKAADLYRNFLFSILLPFTNNPKIFWAVVGLIYGTLSYFINLRIYQFWPHKRDFTFYLLVFVSLCNISLIHLTGLRFFTGAQLIILGSLLYCQGKKWGFLFVILAPAVHFTLISATVAFILWLAIKRILYSKTFINWLLTLSFVVSFVNLGGLALQQFNDLEVDNQMINTKFNAYTNPTSNIREVKSTYRKANDLFTKTFQVISRTGLLVFLLILNNYPRIKSTRRQNLLFTLVVVFAALSFIGTSMTDVFSRFVCLAWGIFFVLFAMLYHTNPNFRFNKWVPWFAVVNFYYIAYLIINAPRLVTPDIWFMPLPIVIYDGLGFRIVH